MTALDVLDAAGLRSWSNAALAELGQARAEIDALNVFPVPDGDTGTNLYLTLEAGTAALDEDSAVGVDLAACMHLLAHGTLLGARGNSGVILSQLMRGFEEVFADPSSAHPGSADAATLAAALRRASDLAYAAVAKPVEGTMLTVARAAAEAVRGLPFGDGVTLEDVVLKAAEAAREALRRTPEQLESLRRAGVVDAGGRGVVVVLDALAQVVTGRQYVSAPADQATVAATPPMLAEDDGAEAGPEFEVMYLLDADESAVTQMRAELEPLGDSLLVIGGGDLWNVHVHVDDVGAAIEAGIRAGRPHRVRVTHFGSQVARQRAGRAVGGRAVIAAAAGEGLAMLFEAAGAQVVLSRPGHRASTGDLLAAIQAAHAEEVVLLPESKDTRMVADAAAEKARGDGIRVAVLPTVASVQVLSALAVHDPGSRFEDDVVAMTGAARATRHGGVTVASREALTSAGICRPGDVLGVLEGDIKLIGHDVSDMAQDVVDRLLGTGRRARDPVAGG